MSHDKECGKDHDEKKDECQEQEQQQIVNVYVDEECHEKKHHDHYCEPKCDHECKDEYLRKLALEMAFKCHKNDKCCNVKEIIWAAEKFYCFIKG